MRKIEIEILQYFSDVYSSTSQGNAIGNGSFNAPAGNMDEHTCSSCPTSLGWGQEASAMLYHPSLVGIWQGFRSSNQVGSYNNGSPPYISGGNMHIPNLIDVITPYPFPGSGTVTKSGIYQTIIGMTPGQTYTLEIDIVSLPGGATPNNMNGVFVVLGIPGNSSYANHGSSSSGIIPQMNDPSSATGSFGTMVWDYNTPLSVGTNSIPFTWDVSEPDGILCLSMWGNSAMNGYAAGQELIISEMRLNATQTTTTTQLTNSSVVGKLDLTDSKNFPLAISLGVADGTDFEKIFGDYSKTFQVPATKNNQKLLGHINNPLILDEKNITAYKDCRIQCDGIETLRGKLKVTGVTQKKKVNFFTCVFYGGNADWGSQLKDKRLCDINFELGDGITGGDDVHFTFANVLSSWTMNQTTSDIVYPLVSYGDFYPDGECGVVNLFDVDSESQDWRFWHYTYNMLVYIFKATGYTISSQFMLSNGAWFKKLICQWGWGKNDYDNLSELCYLKYEGYSDGSTWSTNHNVDLLCNLTPNTNYSGSWEPTTSTPSKPGIQLQTLIQDDFGQYSQDNYTGSATGRITIVREGWARFHFRMGFVLGFFNCATLSTPTPNYGYRAKAFLRLKHNSTIIASGNTPNVDFGANYNGQKEWRTVTIHSNWIKVSVGDTIHAEAKANGEYLSGQSNNSGAFSVCGVNVVTSNKSYIEMEFDGIDIHIGDQFSLKDATPCDIKQTDFIKSIAHMFNLYFYTDVTSKTVYIEPFDTFYQGPSNGQNWDAKIDWSKSIEDKFNIGLKREMLFKYKNDSKDKYQQWINDDMVTGSYPLFSYYTNLGTMFEDGLKKFENPLFSGTMMEYDKDTSGYVVSDTPNLIPVMEKEQCSFGVNTDPCVGRPDKDRFAPRILVYNGYTTNGTFSTNRWTRKVGTSTFTSSQTFPRGVFVDIRQISTLFQNRINLSYNDETHDDGSLTPGLVSNYWTNMIVQLMEKPRTRTMYINLKLTDILNLNLTKLVYIDGSWWRLIKVIDFAPAKNETTKVELIQWIDVAPGGNTT